MRILADLHIAPRTVRFLVELGHDVVRVSDVLPCTASDERVVQKAIEEDRVILTQDLDFSAVIALSGRSAPSLICLRVSSSRVEQVNRTLQGALPLLETVVQRGAIVAVQEASIRVRTLPIAPA